MRAVMQGAVIAGIAEAGGTMAAPQKIVVNDKVRSLAKAVSWRCVGALDTLTLAFIVTGSFTAAGGIVGFELVTKTALYYFHERAWDKVR